MYGEWLLGVVVKARVILLTTSDFSRRDFQFGCCYKKKNGGKWPIGQKFHKKLGEIGEIDVKKREESEKISLKELQHQEMG